MPLLEGDLPLELHGVTVTTKSFVSKSLLRSIGKKSYMELPVNAHCQEYIANRHQQLKCGSQKLVWPPIFRASARGFLLQA